MWAVIGLETGFEWPAKEMTVNYKGHKILLRPETAELAPTIAVEYSHPTTYEEAASVGTEFLSALAWVEGRYVRETIWTGGSAPINVGKGPIGGVATRSFRLDYIPEAADEKPKLALALYREALGNNSVAYQYLGYFKILNVLFSNGPQQINWINSTIPKLTDYHVKERLTELAARHSDLGNHLYASGRCAVAHAFSTPVVNPDDPNHRGRLSFELPVIRRPANIERKR